MKTVRYIFWKFLICALVALPACAVACLLLLIDGQSSLLLEVARGAADASMLPVAAGIGLSVFLGIMGRLFMRLRLGEMTAARFVLLETAAYTLFLAVALLASRLDYLRLLSLPHCFFGELLGSPFAAALNIPLFAAAAAYFYRLNRRREAATHENS